jgi:hypothetical protein
MYLLFMHENSILLGRKKNKEKKRKEKKSDEFKK